MLIDLCVCVCVHKPKIREEQVYRRVRGAFLDTNMEGVEFFPSDCVHQMYLSFGGKSKGQKSSPPDQLFILLGKSQQRLVDKFCLHIGLEMKLLVEQWAFQMFTEKMHTYPPLLTPAVYHPEGGGGRKGAMKEELEFAKRGSFTE